MLLQKGFPPLGHLGSEAYKKDGVTSHPFFKEPISEKVNQKDIANCSPSNVLNLSLDIDPNLPLLTPVRW